MASHNILGFALVALVLTLAPGPDTFLVIANTSAGGVRRGLATVLGIVSGGVFYALLIGCGLARFLVYSPALFHAVKLAGACYLAWLGLGAIRAALRGAGPAGAAQKPARGSYL